jgi:hypothetical protein
LQVNDYDIGEASMTRIIPGSIVSGKSGKTYLVDRVEGDIIHSGTVKFLASAVLKVIPPLTRFKLGDRVRFLGSYQEWGIEYGEILTVVEDFDDEWIKTRTAGRKPISVLRSDLELVEVI